MELPPFLFSNSLFKTGREGTGRGKAVPAVPGAPSDECDESRWQRQASGLRRARGDEDTTDTNTSRKSGGAYLSGCSGRERERGGHDDDAFSTSSCAKQNVTSSTLKYAGVAFACQREGMGLNSAWKMCSGPPSPVIRSRLRPKKNIR